MSVSDSESDDEYFHEGRGNCFVKRIQLNPDFNICFASECDNKSNHQLGISFIPSYGFRQHPDYPQKAAFCCIKCREKTFTKCEICKEWTTNNFIVGGERPCVCPFCPKKSHIMCFGCRVGVIIE